MVILMPQSPRTGGGHIIGWDWDWDCVRTILLVVVLIESKCLLFIKTLMFSKARSFGIFTAPRGLLYVRCANQPFIDVASAAGAYPHIVPRALPEFYIVVAGKVKPQQRAF